MPSDPQDGTWDRPVHLPCPEHNRSAAIAQLQPHLNQDAWFLCGSYDHDEGNRRWVVCRRGWDDAAGYHPWRTA